MDEDHPYHALAAPALGSFQDLMELLEGLDQYSPREPFAGLAFAVSPDQYLTYLQTEVPDNIGPSDYAGGVLYFKSTNSVIHDGISFFFADTLDSQIMDKWMAHPVIKQLLGGRPWAYSTRVRDDHGAPTVDLTPDVGIRVKGAGGVLKSPLIVVEVMYSHRFSQEETEKRYKNYFQAEDNGVKVVICVRLYYGCGVDRANKTAQELERSTISMWTMGRDGIVQTTMR